MRFTHESYTWTPDGDLLSRSFEGIGYCNFKKSYQYDSKGNISKETLEGNLIGGPRSQTFTKTFTYDKHSRLPVEERTDRKWVKLACDKRTRRIKSRLTGYEETVCKREFFTYDLNGILIEEILEPVQNL